MDLDSLGQEILHPGALGGVRARHVPALPLREHRQGREARAADACGGARGRRSPGEGSLLQGPTRACISWTAARVTRGGRRGKRNSRNKCHESSGAAGGAAGARQGRAATGVCARGGAATRRAGAWRSGAPTGTAELQKSRRHAPRGPSAGPRTDEVDPGRAAGVHLGILRDEISGRPRLAGGRAGPASLERASAVAQIPDPGRDVALGRGPGRAVAPSGPRRSRAPVARTPSRS